jgi:nucleotide-binding universal stress UspA family protein
MSRTILVGFDDTHEARRALARALQEADAGDHLVILTVMEAPLDLIEPRSPGVWGESPDVPAGLPAPPEVLGVQAIAEGIVGDAPLEVSYDWAAGDPGPTIVGVARERGADLIVVGSTPHGALASFFGGDVADEVSRGAPCEVLVVE